MLVICLTHVAGTHSNPLGVSAAPQRAPKAVRSANVIAISRSGAVAWDLRNANPGVPLRDVNFGSVVAVRRRATRAAPRGPLHMGGRRSFFYYTDVRSILMVLRLHFKGTLGIGSFPARRSRCFGRHQNVVHRMSFKGTPT